MALVRSNVEALHAYVPGEQPRDSGPVPGRSRRWVKLNTNENPFMAPQIAEAVAEAATDVLRLYPDPLCLDLRRKLSARYGVPPEQIICGNGSDELLTLAVRATAGEGDRIAFPWPSYSLYETLTLIQNASPVPVSLGPNWELPVGELAAAGAKLTLVANPNAPSGTAYPIEQIESLARQVEGVLLLDEAYVDFGGETSLPLLAAYDNVLVLRTMSKGFGLAGVRLGYAFGSAGLVGALYKIKDSYNVDRLTQVAGIAALDAFEEAQRNNQEIAARRDRIAQLLRDRFGWHVWPSATNFILADTGNVPAARVHEQLKERRVLVRYFGTPPIQNCLRISIGAEAEMKALVDALISMLR